MFVLRVLGGLTLERTADGTPVGGQRRKPLALLALLVWAGDAGLTRDRIVGLLWPDDTLDRGRRALAQTAYALRRETGIADLVHGDAVLRVDVRSVDSDLARFRVAFAAADHATAVQRYGGPFLDGVFFKGCVEFERWADAERARLAREHTDALTQLAQSATRAGDRAGAVRWLARAFADDPLNETVAAALVRAMVQTGDSPGALRVVRAYEQLLRSDLDVAPGPSWRQLADTVRSESSRPQTGEPFVPGSPAGSASAGIVADRPRSDLPPVEQAPPGPSPFWQRRTRWVAGTTLTALAILAVARGPSTTAKASRVSPSDASIAVMPFRTGGADSSLTYLREGMAELVAITLGGAGAPRATDPRALFRALPADLELAAALPIDSLAAVARQLGATRFVTGSVVGRSDRLTVHGALYDASVRGIPRAEATVHGPADSIAMLAQRLALQLLVREAPEPSGRSQLLASEPPSAVRAYLAGRSAYRAGQFVRAATDFSRALSEDSTFAYAALGLANAAGFSGDRILVRRAFHLAHRYRDRLAPADRLYLRALTGPEYPVAASFAWRIAAWDSVARASPERSDVWHELGDQYFHLDRFLGDGSVQRHAIAAFERAVASDSRFLPALEHLVLLAARRHDLPRAERAFTAYLGVEPAGETAEFLRWRVERARAAASARPIDSPLQADSLPLLTLRWIAQLAPDDALSLGGRGMRDAEHAAVSLARRATTPSQRADAARALHSVALNRGRPAAAQAQVQAMRDAGADEWVVLRLPVLSALYGDGDRELGAQVADQIARRIAATERNAPAARPAIGAPDDQDDHVAASRERMQAACVLGQWRAVAGDGARRDTGLVDRVLARGARVPALANEATGCRLLLVAQRRGPGAGVALDSIGAMLDAGVDVRRMFPYVAIAVAREHARMGALPQALRSAGRYMYFGRWPYYLATQTRLEADLALATGDTTRAVCALAHHVALRDAPEPALADAVARARTLLERLMAAGRTARLQRDGCLQNGSPTTATRRTAPRGDRAGADTTSAVSA